MIVNNVFRAIGDFCTDLLFAPYDFFRFMDGWWASNLIGSLLVAIGFIFMFYWLGQMFKQAKAGEQ